MLNLKINKKVVRSIFLFVIILLLSTGISTAKTFSVNIDGKADYISIQEAVDAASDGDTILVYPGTYTENINISKSLEIRSTSGPENTIIEASKPDYSAITVTADSVTINDFTISGANSFDITNTNFYLPAPAGLYLSGCHNSKVIGNKFLKNYYGIWFYDASNNTIANNTVISNTESISLSDCEDNTISGNTVSSNNNGISLGDCKDNTIANNSVDSSDYSGIILTNCNKNILENNIVTQNEYIGIGLGESNENILRNNIANLGGEGISLTESNYNELEDNEVHSNEGSGFLVGMNSSNNRFTNNIADKNLFGIILRETTNNTFTNNVISNSFGRAGVSLQYAFYNEFNTNSINANDVYGIEIFQCENNNKFNNNVIKNNDVGVEIEKSSYSITEDYLTKSNTFEGNNINVKTDNMQNQSGSSESSDSNSSNSGSSGESSSGGSGDSPESQGNVEAKEISQAVITNGKYVKFDFPQKATPIINLSFDSKKNLSKTTAISEMLKGKSTLVPDLPSDKVYKSLNIWVGKGGFGISNNIENAEIYFKVEKSWIKNKNIDNSSITLNLYNDSKWNQLPTSLSREDNTCLYYTAKTPGFSSFTITGETVVKEDTNEAKSKPSSQSVGQNNINNVINTDKGSKNTPGFGVLFMVVGLLTASLYKKNKERN